MEDVHSECRQSALPYFDVLAVAMPGLARPLPPRPSSSTPKEDQRIAEKGHVISRIVAFAQRRTYVLVIDRTQILCIGTDLMTLDTKCGRETRWDHEIRFPIFDLEYTRVCDFARRLFLNALLESFGVGVGHGNPLSCSHHIGRSTIIFLEDVARVFCVKCGLHEGGNLRKRYAERVVGSECRVGK